ncbi:hypothetical protein [Chitinophaga sp. 212800010-3]|uniref:hypothetical protein n=1 Tax=unclassified Chitinophaga TaxID=2619133 RepID=UPI002DF2A70F|nr:hypothetical protein [Chitinophaga sp. 212800010-3]
MLYFNPLTFLEKMSDGPVNPEDAVALSRLRKKMMAELELSEDKMLHVNNITFSRHELLLFFDQLQTPGQLAFHQLISRDPVLLHFLETGQITGFIAAEVRYSDDNFLTFISPYFEPVFTAAVLESFKKKNLQEMKWLFGGRLLMNGEYLTKCYRRIFRYGAVLEEQLKLYNEELNDGGYVHMHVLWELANKTLIAQLNLLPEEFRSWRSDYGIAMINLALAAYGKHRDFAMDTILLVRELHTTDYVQERAEVRRNELIAWDKNRLPQLSKFDAFMHKLWKGDPPGWANDRTFSILAVALLTLFLTWTVNRHERPLFPKPVVAKNTDITPGARTNELVKYMLVQLQDTMNYYAGDLIKPDAVHTGEDVYGPGMMAALHAHWPDTTPHKATPEAALQVSDTAASDFTDPLHRQNILLYNRLTVPAVAMIQTPDTFYSCYIAPHDSIFMPLQLAANRLITYVGDGWDRNLKATSAPAGDSTYRLQGFFRKPYLTSRDFLLDGILTFVLDPSYWKKSQRYIPLEIMQHNGALALNLLDNNADGVELSVGL